MRFIFSKKSRRIAELERQVESLTEEAESLRRCLVYQEHPSTWGGRGAGLHEVSINWALDKEPRPSNENRDVASIRAAIYSGYIGPVCSNEDLDLASRVLRSILPVPVGWSLDSASRPIADGIYCRIDDRNFTRPVVLWDSREEAQGLGIPVTSFDELKKTFIEADKAINNTP
jgi:hypothetical protein